MSLDVFESNLYWASQQTGSIMKMDKFGRGINVTLQSGLLLPTTVRVFHTQRHNISGKIEHVILFCCERRFVSSVFFFFGLLLLSTL